ncbi:MAG: hypothetical protein RLZZ362_1369 [Actinomycetota bacterium]|jgi:poly-gamma-glutamate synthesis protein (capsule biosynthesis protein)
MRLALAGDTMLGRGVAQHLMTRPTQPLFSSEVVAAVHEADAVILNLECAISDRGEPWPDPFKRFFFRAPPKAATVLQHLGVSCVTLANNHALDFGTVALTDTFRHLADAGISWVGAGHDETSARAPAIVVRGGARLGVVAVTDHPADFAAGPDRPGVAYADLRRRCPPWLLDAVRGLDTEIVVASPHWGPNMITSPLEHVRSAAGELALAGASLVAGHSAHVFHGVGDRVLFDLGDFIDDYARDPELRNDLGLLFLVTFDDAGAATHLEAVPLALDHCHTRLADKAEAAWISTRLRSASAALGTEVVERGGRLAVEWVPGGDARRTRVG